MIPAAPITLLLLLLLPLLLLLARSTISAANTLLLSLLIIHSHFHHCSSHPSFKSPGQQLPSPPSLSLAGAAHATSPGTSSLPGTWGVSKRINLRYNFIIIIIDKNIIIIFTELFYFMRSFLGTRPTE